MADASAGKLPLSHPAMLVATLGGLGLLPAAPGTFGSLVAVPFAWIIVQAGGSAGLLAASAVLFFVGWWAAALICSTYGKDPRIVVVDEAVGQWLTLGLTLAVAPLDLTHYLAGFVLFRVFDIWKPFPIGWADRRIVGGFGTMIDDVLAAIYAALVLLLGGYLLGR
jgi:phosphatidylglycerophosphatase A